MALPDIVRSLVCGGSDFRDAFVLSLRIARFAGADCGDGGCFALGARICCAED